MQSTNWDDLRVFFALAQTGSLSAASRAIAVQPSTVGRRLAALEQQLGARLFDRTPDGYRLTPTGQDVVKTVAPFAHSLIELERRLQGADASPGGRVRLSVGDAFFVSFLAPRLADLRLRHPQITLDVISTYQQVDLARREADLAIRIAARPQRSNLVVRRLGVERFALYAAPAYLLRRGTPGPTTLAGHDVIAYGGELKDMPAARWLEAHSARATRAAVVSSMLGAAELCKAGLGIVALPTSVASCYGDLQPLRSSLREGREVWLVWHEDLRATARVRVVADYLTEVIRRDLD